jgi:hypothetical protein
MKIISCMISALLAVGLSAGAHAEARKAPFAPRPSDLGKPTSTVRAHGGSKPETLYCSGSCGSGKTYYWQCNSGEHCGINCAANPYAYCYVE